MYSSALVCGGRGIRTTPLYILIYKHLYHIKPVSPPITPPAEIQQNALKRPLYAKIIIIFACIHIKYDQIIDSSTNILF